MFSGYLIDNYLSLKFQFRPTLSLMNHVLPSLNRENALTFLLIP